MRYERVVVLVLDGCGVGVQEDYLDFHRMKTNTLGNVYACLPQLELPFMESLGLSELVGIDRPVSDHACFGKMRQQSAGNDTFAGLWEMLGVRLERRGMSEQEMLPPTILDKIRSECGLDTLCNAYISGFIALDMYYDAHVHSGSPILYLSDDGVVLLAAHNTVISADELNTLAGAMARSLCDAGLIRLITRPFYGHPGSFLRDESSRKDFLLVNLPDEIVMTGLAHAGLQVRTTEHVARILGYPEGVSVLSDPYANNEELFSMIEADTRQDYNVQLYVIPDTDNLGHKKDVAGFAEALLEIDRWLERYVSTLGTKTLLIVTADHGCDPTIDIRGHCREFVPLLVLGQRLDGFRKLGVRDTFSDVGQTMADCFGLHAISVGSGLTV